MSKEEQKPSLETLFREKEKIEQSIKEGFQEYVTIMFTDIAGYTRYVETHGDIAAKSLLQTHNDTLFPIISAHEGQVIKTIGDAVMASFKEVHKGVAAAVEIQKKLKQHNETAEDVKQLNIRIGMNAGLALKDGADYFGDAVNIAARIEPAGSAGQIMVSDSVYQAIEGDKNFYCSYHGLKEAKGKADPLKIYRVFLSRDEQMQQASHSPPPSSESHVEGEIERVGGFRSRWINWKYTLAACFAALAFFIYTGGEFPFHRGNELTIENYKAGFNYLKTGAPDKAKEKFLELKQDPARSKEGLAAWAYHAGDHASARQYSEASLKHDANLLYSRVIEGNILFDEGKYDQASELYTKAAGLASPLNWQKGEALFRLGRIFSSKGDSSKALSCYNQAISFDRQNSDLIKAKAVLLEKMGKLEQALEAFQNAQSITPDDKLISAFTSRIQQKLEMGRDKERQKRIDTLVNELVDTMKHTSSRQPADTWTSRPLSLFIAKMERKGKISLQEGEDDFFQLELFEELRQLPCVSIVDRELLDKLLTELKISSSDLADPETALHLGRIVSARLIGDLTFLGMDNETRIYFKLIETETSQIKVSVSDRFSIAGDQDTAVSRMVGQVDRKLSSAFPIRGRIVNIDAENIEINIGSDVGLKTGMIMGTYTLDGKNRKRTGAVKVTRVETNTASGQIVKGQGIVDQTQVLEVLAL